MKDMRRLFLMLIALLGMLASMVPQRALAGCKLQDTWRYSAMLEGTSQLRLQMPLYDKDDYDCWIVEGTVYIQIEGQEKETLFYYESETDIDSDDYRPYIYCRRGVDGTMILQRDRGYSSVSVGTGLKKDLYPCVDDKDYAVVRVLWDISNKYRGKKVTISWSIHHNGNMTEPNKWLDISSTTLTIPAAPDLQYPMVMDPIISFNEGSPNKMMVPYMISASNIQEVKAYYKEKHWAEGAQKSLLLGTATSDFVTLPSDVCMKDFIIEVTYIDSEKKSQTTKSTPTDLPILHHAKALTAAMQPDGNVQLSWKVSHANWDDISPNDTWEIQRNITGDPTNSEWTSLGQTSYSDKTMEYTFLDDGLLSTYQGKDVYYRVRRVITAVWGWTSQSGYAMTCLPATLALPHIGQATVSRRGEWTDASHPVSLNFTMGSTSNTDDKGRIVIRNAADWEALTKMIVDGAGQKTINVIMAADISVTKPIGTKSTPYRGTFDGNGHTLTVKIEGTEEFLAPFHYVTGTTAIRNLRVQGSVTGGIHSAGLVGSSDDNTTLTIEYCHVSTNVTGTGNSENAPHLGGILGHGHKAKNTLQYNLFDGSITAITDEVHGMDKSYAGALIGWEDGGTDNVVQYNLEAGTYTNVQHAGTNCKYTGADVYGGTNNYNSNNWSESKSAIGLTADQLIAALGTDHWQALGASVVPIMQHSDQVDHKTLLWDKRAKVVLKINKLVGKEIRYIERRELTEGELTEGKLDIDLVTACVDHEFRMAVEKSESNIPLSISADTTVTKTDKGDLAIYKFDNNVVLGNAKADTLQNAVSLTWESTRGQADYYRIKRYDKLTPDEVITLESEYTEKAYIDHTVRPQHNYVYIIEGVTQCEGENVSTTTVEGCCVPTGAVRGYVRLSNGVGLPGITVTADPDPSIIGGAKKTCVTNESGYFEITGLVYQKLGTYTITASGTGSSQKISFDEDVNLHTNIIFYQQRYYTLSGYVLYEGSSIPVSGVKFLRDGVPVINAMGQPVTTNNQGAFEVSIPEGSHTIQVVKDGHVFKNNGFYIDPDNASDPTDHNWQKDMAGIYFWDQTKVQLRGRVVGGDVQGTLPLGKSLSKNNLGADLTIVMQLEGDNTSWIVRDQRDATVTERHEQYTHGLEDKDTTRMDLYRHRIVIHPDTKTGEYCIPIYPVKYKVTEIYAKGYPTLFQTGMVSETVDLNSYVQGDTATYSRIYHSQPTLDIWQFNGTQDRFYGIRQYTAMDNAGERDTVVLWRDGKYTLGHPVFMAGASVPMLLSAQEEYRYNNEEFGKLDIVQLKGGKVTVGNGLIGSDQTDEVELDEDGQGTYVFTPQNTTFLQDNDMALRTMKFTLLYDDSYYDMKPIQAYVMAALAKNQGRRIIAGQNTHLVDILRDPPGGGSSAYIARGSKFSYSYDADYTVTLGIDLSIGIGKGSDFYVGMWAGEGSGSSAGQIHSSSNIGTLSYTLGSAYYQDWSYNYEFEAKEKISTSSNAKEVGANADVYIGMTENVIVEDAIAVRVVPSKALQRLKPGVGGTTEVNGHQFNVTGTTKVLARGWDAEKEDSVYLIRDEVMQLYNKINSTFVHSQAHILNEIIPGLIRTRNALLMDSTTTDIYAQALANTLKSPVYVSKVAPESPDFAQPTYYKRILPADVKDQWNDTIQALNNQIRTWAGFIAANEKEKLEATDMVKVYDFDGRSDVEYSESFTTTEGLHRYWQIPAAPTITGDGIGGDKQPKEGDYDRHIDDDDQMTEVGYVAGGIKFTFRAKPMFGFDFNYKNGMSEEYSKETGFTLSCGRKSNLNVAVYKTREISADSIAKLQTVGDMGFFYKHVEDNLKRIHDGRPGSSNTTSYIESVSKVDRYRNFVYRTLGGATASPWEDERRTIFYNSGTVLDQKTMEIDQLRIWAKEPIVSNVPFGEPARFTIYMTNESEMPDRVTNDLCYYLEGEMNPNGAKVFIDGAPLTDAGVNLWLAANTIIEKQVEIYPNSAYDYENIGISFFNPEDLNRIKTVTLSAHFVPTAGKINISKPGDKWVVNTESAYDKMKQAYYLPVHIDGFDVNYRGFDHIELQYKLSTQGDKDWVNVCSYYRNNEEGQRLMDLASGERKLMEHDGYIDAFFFGETDPIEQYYDIRAVTYCRHGNGYLTSSSNVLSGIKDTRRPRPFGTPQPTNGILGIGDDIKIAFSEPIAGNYLSAVNNFEVLGTTNTSSISLSTALHFNGEYSSADSRTTRNLAGKDFTFEMMLQPADNKKAMTLLSHGSEEDYLLLGLTADRHLSVIVKDTMLVSREAVKFDGLHQVGYAFDVQNEDSTVVTFYDRSEDIGRIVFPGMYYGNGKIHVGCDDFRYLADKNYPYGLERASISNYEGDMLELRLWNKAMTTGEMETYSQKLLTGYELGLIDNYPMNEGRGEYCYDKGVGSNDLLIWSANWKVPDGISLELDGQKGVRLEPKYFARENYQDYTLMFWFRTNDDNGTLLANGQATDELGSESHINIGLDGGRLVFRSNGEEITCDNYLSDNSWHHTAITVNRSRNVGNIYVDQKLIRSFPVDMLGGISGNNLYLGATYTDTHTPTALLTGNIDELAMYEMALPENVMKNYANITPTGTEMGNMVYLPFSRSETQDDNSQRLMPTGISLKRYKDNNGEVIEARRDTIIAQSIVEQWADRSNYAPMRNIGKLENIKFSYVTDGNNLLVNLDMPDYQLEKTNVYLTVKDVADLQGNLMASPLVTNFYVYRNPLRWKTRRESVEAMYGEGATLDVTLENLSGKSQTFNLEGLPTWITASHTSGTISALSEETLRLTISPYINIGDFEEVLYIVGENGTTEPLPLEIHIRGEEPDWAVSDALKDKNTMMHIVARVRIDGVIAHDADDVLAAFGTGHQVLGVAHFDVDQTNSANEALAYLNVYNLKDEPTPLHFEFYDASTGRIHVVMPKKETTYLSLNDTIYFKADTIVGSAKTPVLMSETGQEVQALHLQEGWNWLSFYIEPEEATISNLLNSAATWNVGEGLEVINSKGKPYLFTYKSIMDPDDPYSNLYYWDKGETLIQLNPMLMYRLYTTAPKTAYLSGYMSYASITLHKGWNRIGYISPLNLPVSTALAGYTDAASEGDMVKSQSEFAVLNIDAQGNRVWKGSLKFMRTGEGYMLRRNAEESFTFDYPHYYSSSRYNGKIESANSAPLLRNTTGESMTLIAEVQGVTLEEGDRLVAYMGAQRVGMAEADEEGRFFLSVGHGPSEKVSFTIENQDNIVATTARQMPYVGDTHLGTLDTPTVIDFSAIDTAESQGWYNLQGMRLAGRPTLRGIYIHNGKRVTIK